MKPEHLEDASETTLFDSPIRPVRVIVTAVLRIIQCTFVMVAWMFWAAFGSAFWIALVFRLLAVYTASFLASMFTYQVPTSIEQRLQFVTNLWFDGFRRAYDAVFRPREIPSPSLRADVLVVEVSWCIFFWTVNLLIFSVPLTAPYLPLAAAVAAFVAFIAGVFLGTWKGDPILRFLRIKPRS